MIELLLSGTANGQAGFGWRPPQAIYRKVTVDCRPLPNIGAVGTGGMENGSYYLKRMGYQPLQVVPLEAQAAETSFAKMMQEVKAGFGRTMTHLPAVFGVSRQTLYNWLDGEIPKEIHQPKLVQLAAAARVFFELGFKPTSLSLERTVSNGKSLLQLLSEGADGQETAKKLIRISQRGVEARAKLNQLLDGRRAQTDESDFGTPSLNESA